MQINNPLKGKTVVVTGSKVTTTILQKIEQLGGQAMSCPLIKTVEIKEPDDLHHLEKARSVDWLIFTSQNAVMSFCAKMLRYNLTPSHFLGKIAAVGTKTKAKLLEHGLSVDFVPTVFSADVFVKEFPNVAHENSRCLFVRGKKAKNTIKTGLPFDVFEWDVYETKENTDYIQQLISLIQTKEEIILVFASPSAVDAFGLHIAPYVGWEKIKIASIGHITSNALLEHGAHVSYQPKTYTMEAVLEEIVK